MDIFNQMDSNQVDICKIRVGGPCEELELAIDPDAARVRAEANFKKEERAKEGAQAWKEYEADSRRTREKTERLRALRLAKEAAEKSAG
jgi:hypothetical protein